MRWIWVLLVFCTLGLAQQQDNGSKPKESSNDEKETKTVMETMTVTAEGAPIKIKNTPARVSVIDSERIEKEMARNVSDLIRYEPGVFVERDGSRLNLNGFNIRGIGGNRVRTQIDGVRTAEQFDFGPFSVHQYFVDVETLKTVEILRGAASSLYGSDALGGQVSFQTKDPLDYLGTDRSTYFQVKTGYNSDNEGRFLSGIGAFKAGAFNISANVVLRDHESWDNQGTIDTQDRTRTKPNDIDGRSNQFLLKATRPTGDYSRLRLAFEFFDSQTDTQAFTSQGTSSRFGVTTTISDSSADDTQERMRFSADQVWQPQNLGFADTISLKGYFQTNDTDQRTLQVRASQVGPAVQNIRRSGSVSFDEETIGAQLTVRKTWASGSNTAQLSYGASYEQTEFEQLRDRRDFDLDTGNPDAYRGSLIFPTRYFPKSTVNETGLFAEFENQLWDGRFKWVPGIRYDRYELDPDQNDQIFLDSTQTDRAPVGLDDDALTGRLGLQLSLTENLAVSSQFAMGFRAPPYNSVNSGFTNLNGGYQTLSNPNLEPESSESLEFSLKAYGARGSALLTYFDNDYEDFIQNTVFIGVSDTGLSLFQPQNIDSVSINGFEFEGDFQIKEGLVLRGAYAYIEGENSDTGAPLNTIEPHKGVLGVQYQSNRNWGFQTSATFVSSKSRSDVSISQDREPFLPDAYQLFDATLFWNVSNQFRLNVGAFNIADETYWQWNQVRGRQANDPIIDRYSSPGRTLSVDLQYRW